MLLPLLIDTRLSIFCKLLLGGFLRISQHTSPAKMKTACLLASAASLALFSLAYASPTFGDELTESPEPFAETGPAPAAKPHPDTTTKRERAAAMKSPTLHMLSSNFCLEMEKDDEKMDMCLRKQMKCEMMAGARAEAMCLSNLMCESTPAPRHTRCVRNMMKHA